MAQKQKALKLGVSRHEQLNPLSLEKKQDVFKRDDNTCYFCGFQSEKYQEVHFLNENPNDHNIQNLATACFFCNQCAQLETVSTMGSGVLIWMPEIEQTDLHHVARAIYVARISQGVMAETARALLEIVMARRDEVKRRLGTDDPFVVASVLRDYISDQTYDQRHEKLDGVRLFPLDRRKIKEADLEFNQFPQILAYWRSKQGPFKGEPPIEWLPRYKDLLIAA